jgi:hypothetical protein
MSHRVKPGAERTHFGAAHHGGVGVEERILNGFLGVCLAQDASTVPDQ